MTHPPMCPACGAALLLGDGLLGPVPEVDAVVLVTLRDETGRRAVCSFTVPRAWFLGDAALPDRLLIAPIRMALANLRTSSGVESPPPASSEHVAP